MYKCDICGRDIFKKIRLKGHTLCSKHMHQLLKYGEFLDNNPRTNNDMNEFRYLDNETIEMDVYNQKSEKVSCFVFDSDDLQKVRYHKWRIDSNGRIITGNCSKKNPRREFSRFVMNVNDSNVVVDHIDGNPLNNHKSNLRICTQGENKYNISYMSNSTSGIVGVVWDKHRGKWTAEIRKQWMRCHLGRYNTFSEAVCARYFAERYCFGRFQNSLQIEKELEVMKSMSPKRVFEIKTYTANKLASKGFQQEGHQLCGNPEYAKQYPISP